MEKAERGSSVQLMHEPIYHTQNNNLFNFVPRFSLYSYLLHPYQAMILQNNKMHERLKRERKEGYEKM